MSEMRRLLCGILNFKSLNLTRKMSNVYCWQNVGFETLQRHIPEVSSQAYQTAHTKHFAKMSPIKIS